MTLVRDLLASAIDYAGLFPPAGLDMASAVRTYAVDRRGDRRWALGKFILPVSRLEEFEGASAGHLSVDDPWPLSLLVGTDLAADLRAIAEFTGRRRDLRVASLEAKATTAEEIRDAASRIGGETEAFFEVPIVESPAPLIEAVRAAGGRAKVRTGGTQASAFPSPFEVARFLHDCAAAKVAFKATAGLHHPVRCVRPLTYEAGSATGIMHGFLNVFLAAAWVREAMDVADVSKLLEETTPGAFRFDGEGAHWRQRTVSRASVIETRKTFALSFGSCSFREPLDELEELGFL